MHSSRAPAGVSCLHAQVINEMLNQWFNKTLFSQSLFFAFSSDVASPQSSTWGGVLRWHSHKPIVASWAVDYGDPGKKGGWSTLRQAERATWVLWNGFCGAGHSQGGALLHHLHPQHQRRGCWGGFTLAGEPRLVTPLHTHCGGRAPAKYITALHRWLRWNRITKYITALHQQWHQWNSY